jgi:hypothetical protein
MPMEVGMVAEGIAYPLTFIARIVNLSHVTGNDRSSSSASSSPLSLRHCTSAPIFSDDSLRFQIGLSVQPPGAEETVYDCA